MSERKKFIIALLVMAAGSLVIAGITITILYRAALHEQRARLMETVFSQSRLITAVFQFASTYYLAYPQGAEAATLYQVKAAYQNFKGFGETGEFTLAKREDDHIRFLLELRHGNGQSAYRIPWDSGLAEPMCRALAGESGTMVGLDYRGVLVLAAYEPIKVLQYGIVAKLDMKEIRYPFEVAAIVALGFAGLIVLALSMLFLRISNPIIETLESRTAHLSVAIDRLRNEALERRRTQKALEWELSVNFLLSQLFIPLVRPQSTIEHIAHTILQKTTELTGSPHGYVSSIDPETGDNIGHTLTEMLKGQCNVAQHNQQLVFPVKKDGSYNGLWGHSLNTRQSFFTNSPARHEAARGLPVGHIPLERLLSVPVLYGDQLVGQIALANKPTDYTDQDLEAVKRIAEFYALAIFQRRTQDALRKAHDDLEQRVDERTAQLRESNVLLKQKIAAQQMAEEALKESENNLRRLSSKILDAHEEEQKRIGQELHDGLAQSMSAMKVWAENALMQLARDDHQGVIKSLNNLVPLAQAAVEDVRRISKNLRPSILDDLGILATISWLCSDFQNLYAHIKIEKEIAVEENQIPERLKLIIFRVLQEALNNVAKHSHARHLSVSLESIDDRIELKISDDGIGFDIDHVTNDGLNTAGLGLASMKERVHYSEGEFKIQSQKDSGTRITAIWPVA